MIKHFEVSEDEVDTVLNDESMLLAKLVREVADLKAKLAKISPTPAELALDKLTTEKRAEIKSLEQQKKETAKQLVSCKATGTAIDQFFQEKGPLLVQLGASIKHFLQQKRSELKAEGFAQRKAQTEANQQRLNQMENGFATRKQKLQLLLDSLTQEKARAQNEYARMKAAEQLAPISPETDATESHASEPSTQKDRSSGMC